MFFTILFTLVVKHTTHAQAVVYQTGFEAPGYVTGNLVGQNGWTAGSSASRNAAQIIAVSGGQELEISGPLIAQNNGSFSKSLANYNPVASGTPIVDVSADVWQKQGLTTSQSSWQFAFLVLNDQNGNAYGTVGIDQNGIIFGQDWGSPNQVIGDGTTDTNGFHNLKLELNFTNRTITLFHDGFSCGSMAFNPTASNLLGNVTLVLQGGSPIDSMLYLDNLSITAGSMVSTTPCDLQIVSAGPCLASDCSYGIPKVGDAYGLKVIIKVLGTPAKPFRIKWTLANTTNYYANINVGPGSGWWWPFIWGMDLDDPIPWSVTLDPDGVSGDTNLANNTASGTFTPIPPTNAVELYAPRMMHGSESSSFVFQPGSGTIPNLYILFGVPTSHGAQSAISVSGPVHSRYVVTAPDGVPVFEIARTNVPAATFQDTNSFIVQLNSIRVNPSILRTNTWAGMSALTTNWAQWLAPDSNAESTNALITAFVQQSLPVNYRTTLTPYDTARTLHKAVAKKLTYGTASYGDAVGVLQEGVAGCGGFSALLVACLRNVGIPARCISGFREGDTVWHVRTEFHLPGVDWLVADATDCYGNDPTGSYAYDFGYVPSANSFLAVDVGGAHILTDLPTVSFEGIQVPNWWWNGGATFNSNVDISSLQPNGILNWTNAGKGYASFYLSDPPTAGSVVIQASTNLASWTSIATNSTTGNILNYSFPATNVVRQFYRAKVIP